jgi:hypothetical protein
MPLASARRTAFCSLRASRFKFRDQFPHRRLIGAEFSGIAINS